MLSVDSEWAGATTVGVDVTSKVLVETKVLDLVCPRGCAGSNGPGDVGNTFSQQLTGTLPVELGEPRIVRQGHKPISGAGLLLNSEKGFHGL